MRVVPPLYCSVIFNTVPVPVKLILPALLVPNATDRSSDVAELNIPVFNVTPSANINVAA